MTLGRLGRMLGQLDDSGSDVGTADSHSKDKFADRLPVAKFHTFSEFLLLSRIARSGGGFQRFEKGRVGTNWDWIGTSIEIHPIMTLQNLFDVGSTGELDKFGCLLHIDAVEVLDNAKIIQRIGELALDS